MNELQRIIGDYPAFLKQIIKEMVDEGFDLADFVQMDHMCYRVTTIDQYATKKLLLSKVATLLAETQISGRPISTFRLPEPVRCKGWRVDAIELPAPKTGTHYEEGLEHVEFVLFDDKDFFLNKYAHKQFQMKSADRGINPEIGFKLPSYTVKFHLLSLTTVVYLEKKLGITTPHVFPSGDIEYREFKNLPPSGSPVKF